jgi:hypothetical protein
MAQLLVSFQFKFDDPAIYSRSGYCAVKEKPHKPLNSAMESSKIRIRSQEHETVFRTVRFNSNFDRMILIEISRP